MHIKYLSIWEVENFSERFFTIIIIVFGCDICWWLQFNDFERVFDRFDMNFLLLQQIVAFLALTLDLAFAYLVLRLLNKALGGLFIFVHWRWI